MRLIEIPTGGLEELVAFLSRDAAQNGYALGVLEEHGLQAGPEANVSAYGLFEESSLAGVIVVGGQGGLVMPCVPDSSIATEIGRHMNGLMRVRSIIGERSAVDAMVKAMGCGPPAVSRAQRLFSASADDLGPFVCPGLRLAKPEDRDALVAISIEAIRDAAGENLEILGAGHRAEIEKRVEARVLASRTFVLADGPRIQVKIDVGAKCKTSAQIESVHTVLQERHRGLATLALGQLSRTMLSSTPRLTIRVDERDNALAAVCRKVGYLPIRAQRLVIFR